MAQTDEYSLNRSDLKELLEDTSKIRCMDLEFELGLETGIELYSYDSGKYLVYFSDDKSGVLYESKQELIKVATPPSEIPEYEDWIEEMNLTLEDITDESKSYPLLSELLEKENISIKDSSLIEEYFYQGKLMTCNTDVFKEFLIFSVEVIYSSNERATFILEPIQKNGFEILLESKNRNFNLTSHVWNSIFEPYHGYFADIVSW